MLCDVGASDPRSAGVGPQAACYAEATFGRPRSAWSQAWCGMRAILRGCVGVPPMLIDRRLNKSASTPAHSQMASRDDIPASSSGVGPMGAANENAR
jgi:hypothetical protein